MTITTTHNKPRAQILRQVTTARPTVVRLATASVLASIALGASGGTAAAEPAAPLPTFTGSSSLENLLLTDLQVGARNLHRRNGLHVSDFAKIWNGQVSLPATAQSDLT